MPSQKQLKKKSGFFENILSSNQLLPAEDTQQGLQFLMQFFGEIRPHAGRQTRNATENLRRVTTLLQQQHAVLANFQHALMARLKETRLVNAITESGIPLARGFWQELSNRFKHKILPPLLDEQDFLFTLNHIFYKKNDYRWVEAIPREDWIAFFEAAGFHFGSGIVELKRELFTSMKLLSFQVAQLGNEKEILRFLPERDAGTDSVFVQQNYLVHELESASLGNSVSQSLAGLSNKLKGCLRQCHEQIEFIRSNHNDRGASLHQTYLLMILQNRLQRMELLADILDEDQQFDTGRFTDLFRMLIRNEKRKNSLLEFISQSMAYLAYQIAEHKGAKGDKYITSSRPEFYKMIRTAMFGGFIISFIAIFKNLLGKLNLALIPQGFLYSFNYSLGFVAIENFHATLATKQPAFTASAVAASLDSKKAGEPDLQNLAATVAKISRSQLASFFGNLIIVFPLSFILAWVYNLIWHIPVASGEQAMKMLTDQHPWRSPALFYACITGFFLFLSGIIAGYVQNKLQYSDVQERLKKHPALRHSFSPQKLSRIAAWVERNAGALTGNIALGFFLGFAGIFGKMWGIHFDIRHITISAGNTAIAVYGLGLQHIPVYFMLAVLGGVLAIGFLNFLVSFSLAFLVAVKSRGIRIRQYPHFFSILIRYFASHTREFFLPPRSVREPVFKPLVKEGEPDSPDR